MMGLGLTELMIILFFLVLFIAIPVLVFGPVVKKAGFSKWWSLLVVIPIVNIVMIWVFSFIKWPAQENT